MVKLFAVIYILCSMYASNPEANRDYFAQNFINTIALTSETSSSTFTQNNNITITDYVKELKKLGYYREEYESVQLNTRNAIIRFQSDHNLVVDGIWGEKSLSTLKKRLIQNKLYYNDEITNPPSEKKWIVINKTKRILTLYENKSVIKKYPVAIGNPPSLTPSGKFSILNKIINPDWGGGGYAEPVAGGSPENPLGYRWLGLSYGGGDDYGIHGNNNPYSIGKNITHGCIRMINSDVEELFAMVPLHTEVWIGTEKELGEWGVKQKEY